MASTAEHEGAAAPSDVPRTDVDKALLGGSTYRSLSELGSGAEERFEKGRRLVGWFLAPLVSLVFGFLPLDMPGDQQTLAAVLLGVVVLWICEPIPIPIGGLVGVAAIVVLGVAPGDDVLAPFGSTTIFTFIGAFILAQAMLKHGVAQRVAYFVLGLPGVGRSTFRTIVAFGVITCALSAFISNTATVAMLMPTALGILAVIAKLMQAQGVVRPDFDPMRLRVGTALMLMLAYGASVGGLLTPVGSPPNLIGRGLIEEATGERISFGQWMLAALPICLIMFVVLAVVLILVNRPEIRRIDGVEEFIRERRAEQGPMSRAEKNTVIAFGITVTLWLVPAVVGLVSGTDSSAYATVSDRLDEGVAAVIGAALLFILPVNWSKQEATLTWKDAAKIDWGTILLFGTGIIFGAMLSATGLAETIGNGASDALGITSAFAITAFAVILAVLISETTSNTASAAVVVPIIIPLAAAAGVDPLVPALAATFAASLGFMLPVSTPQNAIVYGTGCVPMTKMIRSGITFDLIGAAVIIALMPLMVSLTGIGS
ncbi:DASS family sodium-coupled anion symporter [Glycomyces scopariae]|uniref:Sodium-dependent dicarboxylate transporter SdcS n=1 Tax=Glycomyces sambucus TaxID=380244 RepID=A0A1G9FEC4_9ACTN|nr:DASS family sodium-coupled anion symporter [Glycomyces sambucus]SDK86720.1 solute carrier family 13 (sodium-dependent dicarboxylate transporter), member 2/3/5 [Glycomyces sambucus]